MKRLVFGNNYSERSVENQLEVSNFGNYSALCKHHKSPGLRQGLHFMAIISKSDILKKGGISFD